MRHFYYFAALILLFGCSTPSTDVTTEKILDISVQLRGLQLIVLRDARGSRTGSGLPAAKTIEIPDSAFSEPPAGALGKMISNELLIHPSRSAAEKWLNGKTAELVSFHIGSPRKGKIDVDSPKYDTYYTLPPLGVLIETAAKLAAAHFEAGTYLDAVVALKIGDEIFRVEPSIPVTSNHNAAIVREAVETSAKSLANLIALHALGTQ